MTAQPVFAAPRHPVPVRLALAAIRFYQHRISPRKGWRCAHRACHGGHSCSEWTKRAVARRGLQAGVLLARRRFARCHAAATALRAARWDKEPRWETEEERKKREGNRNGGASGDGWCVGGPSALCSPLDASALSDCACCLLELYSYIPFFPFCL